MEHDVGVSGGYWRYVLDRHLEPPHANLDLLSWRVGYTPRPSSVHTHNTMQWNINMRHGSVSQSHVPSHEVALHFGPLVRYSSRYLSFLETESSLRGTTGHSEIVVTTLCNITSWCTMGNLSVDVMGGKDGGLFDYKIPKEINSPIYHALGLMKPGKLLHPVRNVATTSDPQHITSVAQSLASANTKTTKNSNEVEYDDLRPDQRLVVDYFAKCLLRNPRPPYPSYNCPIGCPWHEQSTCPTVNCMGRGDNSNGTYLHMAINDCVSLCKITRKCPWTTGTKELVAIAKRGEGYSDILD
jgi:hypothetical protein